MGQSYLLNLTQISHRDSVDMPYASFRGIDYAHNPVIEEVPDFHLAHEAGHGFKVLTRGYDPDNQPKIQIFPIGGSLGLGYGHTLYLRPWSLGDDVKVLFGESLDSLVEVADGSRVALGDSSGGEGHMRFVTAGGPRLTLGYHITTMDARRFNQMMDPLVAKARAGDGTFKQHFFKYD